MRETEFCCPVLGLFSKSEPINEYLYINVYCLYINILGNQYVKFTRPQYCTDLYQEMKMKVDSFYVDTFSIQNQKTIILLRCKVVFDQNFLRRPNIFIPTTDM